MKKKILVTGGLGYIGSHTVVELLRQEDEKYDVVVVDNLSNSNIKVYDRLRKIQNREFKLYICDVADKKKMQDIFKAEKIEAVIHFAGYKAVGESVSNPLKYYRNNLETSINLLELCREFNVNKFVFSSSATVYGLSKDIPLNETIQKSTINPYAKTKAIIEDILQDVVMASNGMFNVIALRYFNPLGAHYTGEIGEDPTGIPNNLAPYITQVAVGKLEMLSVFGSDYPTKDGTCIRDYVHVMDLAHGHVKAVEKLYSDMFVGFEAVNLGSGVGYSVFDIINNFEDVIGEKIPYVITGRRDGDLAISVADIKKANEILGWYPKKKLKEMCEDSWRWQSKNPMGY